MCHSIISTKVPVFFSYLSIKIVPYEKKQIFKYFQYSLDESFINQIHCSFLDSDGQRIQSPVQKFSISSKDCCWFGPNSIKIS